MILHQNICGLLGKLDILEVELGDFQNKNQNIDVICLSETFVKKGCESNIKFTNFKLASSYCRQKSRGGTAVLVRKTLEAKPMEFMSNLASDFYFECCGVEISAINLIVIAIYRIPQQTQSHIGVFLHKMEILLQYLSLKHRKKKVVLCGDWNIDTLKQNTITKNLISIMRGHNIKMHIQTPTRNNACIDQIASNMRQVKSSTHTLHLSDHDKAQCILLNIEKIKSYTSWFEFKRDYCMDNIRKFYDCIKALSFCDVLSSENAQEAFTIFYDLLKLFYDLCFPVIRVKVSRLQEKVRWVTKGIRKSCRVKRQMLIRSRNARHDSVPDKLILKNYSKLLKRCIQNSQKISNNKYISISKNKCKATWNLIASRASNTEGQTDINYLKFDNKIVSNSNDICNILNDYFIRPCSLRKKKSTDKRGKYIENNQYTMFLNPITDGEVFNIVKSLKNTNACGIDDISTEIIKVVGLFLSYPLAHIINLSFSQSYFPQELKMAKIKPLFKKGDPCDPGNYRPIAIVPILSKIVEKAFCVRLMDFITRHNILHTNQYGFREGYNTELACFDFVKYVTESINNKIPVMSIFLDMTKAFDLVDHSKLLDKLDSYGVRGQANDWLQSYLSNRKQCTEITKIQEDNNQIRKVVYRSSDRTVVAGVPQGSNLGPLLFLLFINDLPMATKPKSILFADDTTIIVRGENPRTYEADINKALSDINLWINDNDLLINHSKTNFMQFSSVKAKPSKLNIRIEDIDLQEANSVKFLGLNIDPHLNWKGHVDFVCLRLDRFVYALRKLRQNVSQEAAITAYHGHVSSILNYGLTLWGNSVSVDRVFLLQKKCVRAISNAWMRCSCKIIFKKLSILPLACIYIYKICNFVKNFPIYFQQRSDTHSNYVREQYRYLLYQPRCKKDIYKRNSYNMCILIFNNLPVEVKTLEGNAFKRKLRCWLLENCFYSVQEFMTYRDRMT
jgi:exonuclease III